MTNTGVDSSTQYYLVGASTAIEAAGEGPAMELGALAGRPLLLVLRIEAAIEQESLLVSVWASSDGKNWGAKPLFSFPEKFYAGVTPAALDLRQRDQIRFLQARWNANRWGRGYPVPFFKFSLEVEELKVP
jgi:hypothetical protein